MQERKIFVVNLKNYSTNFYAKSPMLQPFEHRSTCTTVIELLRQFMAFGSWKILGLGSIFISDAVKNTSKKDHKQNSGVEKQIFYFLELIITSCKQIYRNK